MPSEKNVNVNCGYLNLDSEGLTYIRMQSDLQVIKKFCKI